MRSLSNLIQPEHAHMEFVEVVVNVPVRGPFARARMDASAVDAAERIYQRASRLPPM